MAGYGGLLFLVAARGTRWSQSSVSQGERQQHQPVVQNAGRSRRNQYKAAIKE